VILYECLAGVRPLEGSVIGQVVTKLLTEGITPLDEVVGGLPPEVTRLVALMLSRKRGHRPGDLRQVNDVLRRFAGAQGLPLVSAVDARRRTPRVAALAVGLRARVTFARHPWKMPSPMLGDASKVVLRIEIEPSDKRSDPRAPGPGGFGFKHR
jgi:hypothetical protein